MLARVDGTTTTDASHIIINNTVSTLCKHITVGSGPNSNILFIVYVATITFTVHPLI